MNFFPPQENTTCQIPFHRKPGHKHCNQLWKVPQVERMRPWKCQLAVLVTRIAFKTFRPRHAQKSKFWVTYGFRLFNFSIFFSPFLFIPAFFLLLWLAIFRACLGLKKISGRVIEVANFHHGAARCSGRKFGSQFFAQLFEHFWAYLRFQLANHCELGFIGKILFSCRSWVYMMPNLVKVMTSEVEERPRLVTGGYGRHRRQWVKHKAKMTSDCFLFKVFLLHVVDRALIRHEWKLPLSPNNVLIIWLALWVGKMNQILHCYWFTRAGKIVRAILPARDYPPCRARKAIK